MRLRIWKYTSDQYLRIRTSFVKYGIDINALTREKRTGVERYVFLLLSKMMKVQLHEDEEVVLYASKHVDDIVTPHGWRERILNWVLPKGWTHGRLSAELITRPPDVFFTPAHEIPKWFRKTKIVTAIHDVAFRFHPELYSARQRRRQEWAVRRAVKYADALITVSETTKKDLVELYRVDASKIHVTPLAVDASRFDVEGERISEVLDRYALSGKKYLLSVGRIESKKNIGTLLRAFDAYKRAEVDSDLQLVLVGGLGEGAHRVLCELDSLDYKDSVKLLGYVADGEVESLYRGAAAYVFPSWYEGFGLPVLEAFAAKVPLLASDIPALREVAGDAAVFARPDSVEEWTRGLRDVLSQGEVKVQKGIRRLEEFSWERTARQTWEVLRSVKK